jgi:hypothetical protein
LDAFAGRLRGKSTYFSLLFSSTIFTVNGSTALNAVAVALSYSVAVKVILPTIIFILVPIVFVLLFVSFFDGTFLLQDAQLISDMAKNKSINKSFIEDDLECRLVSQKKSMSCIS